MSALPDLQYEAAWCLTNIATGTTEQTECLTEKGVVPKFITLMNCGNDRLKEQAVWALGNISGENADLRNLVLKNGMLPGLLEILNTSTKVSLLKNACWALSNLVRGKPPPNYESIKDSIPVLFKLLKQNEEKEILADCCWTLSYIGEFNEHKIQELYENSILIRLVQLLE